MEENENWRRVLGRTVLGWAVWLPQCLSIQAGAEREGGGVKVRDGETRGPVADAESTGILL